jgi:hypothetical protein
MSDTFEFISPTDRPALLGLSNPEWLAKCRAGLNELGYKIHMAANHEDFIARFQQVHYQVALLEERFAANSPEENLSLVGLQHMPMNQRRHATIFLLGDGYVSLHPMQAFQQSVHAVINSAELGSLKAILQQVVADNDLFLQVFRDTMMQITAWGK